MSGNVILLTTFDRGKLFTQPGAIAAANQRRLVILPNNIIDPRLVRSSTWRFEIEVYPVCSGTLIAYVEPNERMGKFISFKDNDTGITYVFKVPRKAIGAKNIALAVNHLVDARGRPLIEYKDKGEKQVLVKIHDMSKIGIVEAFPEKSGWGVAEEKFGIPVGLTVDHSNDDARHLSRTDAEYVGFIVRGRGRGLDAHYGRGVYVNVTPSGLFGVLVWENAVPAAEPAMK